MWIVYCRSHRRRPVGLGRALPFSDPQARIPTGWCACCGQELFGLEPLCDRCRCMKGEL